MCKKIVSSQVKSWKQRRSKGAQREKQSAEGRLVGQKAECTQYTRVAGMYILYLFFIIRSGGTKSAIMLITSTCILYRDARPSCQIFKHCVKLRGLMARPYLSRDSYFCPVLPETAIHVITLRILEIHSVLSQLCYFPPEFVLAFRLLSSMVRFISPVFVLAPHYLNSANRSCSSRLLTLLHHVYISKLVTSHATFSHLPNKLNCYCYRPFFHANHFKGVVGYKKWCDFRQIFFPLRFTLMVMLFAHVSHFALSPGYPPAQGKERSEHFYFNLRGGWWAGGDGREQTRVGNWTQASPSPQLGTQKQFGYLGSKLNVDIAFSDPDSCPQRVTQAFYTKFWICHLVYSRKAFQL